MKKYFKDIDTETKVKIVMENQKLCDKACEIYYEYSMETQLEEGNLMLGEKDNGIDIKDSYSTFYFVLLDWHKFLDNLDKDYLCQDGLDLYDKIMKLKEEYENIDMVENEDRFDELEEEIENYCKELLRICEKQLHEYEHYTYEDVKEYLKFEFDENNLWDNYYIIEDDTTKVYNDVSYTETFQ